MHTEFLWIVFCREGSVNSLRRWKRSGSRRWSEKNREESRIVVWQRCAAAKNQRETAIRGVRESFEKAKANGGFLFQFTVRYIISKKLECWCVPSFCAIHAIHVHSHGKPPSVNSSENPTHGSVEGPFVWGQTFSYTLVTFPRVAFCTFTRTLLYQHLATPFFFRLIRPRPIGFLHDPVARLIVDYNLFSTDECTDWAVSNDWIASARHTASADIQLNVTKTAQWPSNRDSLYVRPRLTLNIRGCRQMDNPAESGIDRSRCSC